MAEGKQDRIVTAIQRVITAKKVEPVGGVYTLKYDDLFAALGWHFGVVELYAVLASRGVLVNPEHGLLAVVKDPVPLAVDDGDLGE